MSKEYGARSGWELEAGGWGLDSGCPVWELGAGCRIRDSGWGGGWGPPWGGEGRG